MRRRMRFLVMVLSVSLLFSGCGTQLFEMTDEERSLITTYAAYVVSLHNTFQKDGLVSVTMPVDEEEDVVVVPDTETQKQEEEPSGNAGGGSSSGTQAVEQEKPGMTLAEAIGHGKDLSISLKGCSVDDHYTQGEGYSVAASDGRVYIIAEFTIKNISGKKVRIDNLSLNPSFRCHYNGSENAVAAEITFLDTDLGSYEGSIAAGKSAGAVLLFEVPAKKGLKVSSFELSVLVGGEVNDIEL